MCVYVCVQCSVLDDSNYNGAAPTARARDFRNHAHSIYQPARAITHKINFGLRNVKGASWRPCKP